MIEVGTHIRNASDQLTKVPVSYLANAVQHPKPAIEAKLRQLRAVRKISVQQYSVLKRELPYFVCGIFSPPYRKTENFAYIEYFVVDIDHISEKGLIVADLKARLSTNPASCFVLSRLVAMV